ncbi:putative tail protein [Campylobacter phage F379]|uniref:Putative tail protein n=1 Tax=Campylobacter phage F379 TaxID=2776767 RepID=A0A7L8ZK30_9CAUD|nr:putative tail protein [Campylobacter phage F379]
MAEIKTGILLRRNLKKHFVNDAKPTQGEIVLAIDTNEIGMLVNDEIQWTPIQGVVNTVAGKQGDVELNKKDVGLENVDNTADIDKPISNSTKLEFQRHYTAENPHNITKKTLGLENVDNTADIDKPISNLTQIELNKKISWDDARKQAGGKDPVFTDTTYTIKDGELSEFNFNSYYKNFIDTFNTNSRVLPSTQALTANGRIITLRRADGSSESIETQDTLYDDSELRALIEQAKIDLHINIQDNLESDSTKDALSANQGKVLKGIIDEIKKVINITDDDFKNLQDIINYIEENREKFDDLTIANIKGLQAALDSKLNRDDSTYVAPNSALLESHPASDFVLNTNYNAKLIEIRDSLNSINSQIKLFETQSGVDSKINQAIRDLNFTETIQSINEQIARLQGSLDRIDLDTITENLQKVQQDLTSKIEQLETNTSKKLEEFEEIVNNFDMSEIQTNINNFKDQITQNINSIQGVVDSVSESLSNIENNIQTSLENKVSKDELAAEVKTINDNITRLSSIANEAKWQDNFYSKNSRSRKALWSIVSIAKDSFKGSYKKPNTYNYWEAKYKNLKYINDNFDSLETISDAPTYDVVTNQVIKLTFSDITHASFLIGSPKNKIQIAKIVAVNANTKKVVFIYGYPSFMSDDLSKIMVTVERDSSFGNYLSRANKTDPETFQKIVTTQEFDLPDDNDNYSYFEASYEISGNIITLTIPETAFLEFYGNMTAVETTVTGSGTSQVWSSTLKSTDYEGNKLFSNGVLIGKDLTGEILTIYDNKSTYINTLGEARTNYNDFQIIREEYEDIMYTRDFLPGTIGPGDDELEW